MANKKKSILDSDSTQTINPAKDVLQIDKERAKVTDPVLIVIRGTPQGKKYSLENSEYILGRDKTADIQLQDDSVSREHAKVSKTSAGVYIEDFRSHNGTFVNAENIGLKKRLLAKEDMIKLGSTVLKYLPAGELETLYYTNLTNAASMDKLTDLYNRDYISEVLEVEFKRAKALHSNFSIVLFDIDDFKRINDVYGHPGGDYVLSAIGKTVKASGLRKHDMAGRYGGEEFLIILPGANQQQASDVAERIRKSIENHHFTYEKKKIHVTVSLGVASLKDTHGASSDLYKAADRALYDSKRAGKNKVTLAA